MLAASNKILYNQHLILPSFAAAFAVAFPVSLLVSIVSGTIGFTQGADEASTSVQLAETALKVANYSTQGFIGCILFALTISLVRASKFYFQTWDCSKSMDYFLSSFDRGGLVRDTFGGVDILRNGLKNIFIKNE